MGSSYTWCNSCGVTPFLSHRFMRDPTDKNKTLLSMTTLNTDLINSLLIISLFIKYFFCLLCTCYNGPTFILINYGGNA